MESIKNNIYFKLNRLIDSELEKEKPNSELICDCVDGILRLMPENSYQLTAEQRKNNILSILNEKPNRKVRSRFSKILLAAAIITTLLVGSVFAYTIIEYKIHNYDTYSTVWANIMSKRLDKPVEVSYIPEGFELVDTYCSKISSSVVYENSDGTFITITKDIADSVDINTEFVKAKRIKIGDIEYVLYGEPEHGKGVVWFADNLAFAISSSLPDKELLKIAQGVS